MHESGIISIFNSFYQFKTRTRIIGVIYIIFNNIISTTMVRIVPN